MSVENRDFIIERLERQLLDKEHEFEELKITLRDSIMSELRRELKDDLDINNRIIKIEQKVSELSNTLNGMMDELLDQKSELRSIRNTIGQKNTGINSVKKNSIISSGSNPVPGPVVTQPYITKTPARTLAPVNPATSQSNHAAARNQNKAQVNIRNIEKKEPEPEIPEPEPKTEYIIAESGNVHPVHSTRNNRSPTKSNRPEYIVAEDKKVVRRDSQIEDGVETVEKRNSEDVEIITTRKKSGL
ncbi:MAG TPA: hypothetical protein C5S50_08175 [Methanosarcinaceae archaeon]|nr:hypothetical protein [Methanosarcinaceae archaeon]